MSIDKHTLDLTLSLADDKLILGHRLSEWCGHGPYVEEDLALANIALDLLGAAQSLYNYAAELHPDYKTADDFAYMRDDLDFKNAQLLEQPNEDYAHTMLRQFFYDTYDMFILSEISKSKDDQLKAIAEKSLKETKYHWRHSSEWILRFGDGTEESHNRTTKAVNELWTYTGDLFSEDEAYEELKNAGIAPDMQLVKLNWLQKVKEIFQKATLEMPDPDAFMRTGGRSGFHTEHLGYILSEMQFLKRTHPEAEW